MFSARARVCGPPLWQVDTGSVPLGQAAWCPIRARQWRRGYWQAPAAEELVSLVEFEHALTRLQRVRLPEWVVFAPHEDAFVPGVSEERRLEVVAMMRRLIHRGVGIALTTRGEARDAGALLALVAEAPDRFAVRVGVFAPGAMGGGARVDPVEARWEVGLPSSGRRLELAQAVARLGARVEVELGPIVPFVNDDSKLLGDAVRAIARAGIHDVVLRWIEDAPGLERQIEAEVSASTARLVTGWFRSPGGQVGPAAPRILPEPARRHRREAVEEAGRLAHVGLATCACVRDGASVACHAAIAPRDGAQLQLLGLA